MTEENLESPLHISPEIGKKLLPFSFLESHLYEKMHQLLGGYMSKADALFMLSEIKNDLLQGFTSLDNSRLHTIIHHCVKCPLAHPPVLPSWNCTDPDLLIVVDNPVVIESYGTLLFEALKQAGFSSERCMLTYTVRCRSSEMSQSFVNNCLPYLHTEVAIANPKLILTLGLNPFRLLVGDNLSKLSDIKGIIRTWGLFSVLPEISLGALYHMRQKSEVSSVTFEASLKRAHSFLYPGG